LFCPYCDQRKNNTVTGANMGIYSSLVIICVLLSDSNCLAEDHFNNIKYDYDNNLNGIFGEVKRCNVILCSLHCKCRILEKLVRLLLKKNPTSGDKVS
jgi:hypothetical protein